MGRSKSHSSVNEVLAARDLLAGGESASDGPVDEGLRERKKRETRQQISDTATMLFLAHGFDAVRVADVAEACGVSEKTVYNYFPTKESLLLDREPLMIAGVRRTLGPDAPEGSPVDAFVRELIAEVERFAVAGADKPGTGAFFMGVSRFRALIESTPSLRAAQRDMMDRITTVAAQELAFRAGVDPSDPEPIVAATAICSLWGVMFRSMEREGGRVDASADDVVAAVTEDLQRAARLIDTGLWSFGLEVQGDPDRSQIEEAAAAAQQARLQVMEAVRSAKLAWRHMAAEAHAMHESQHPGTWRGGPPGGARGATRGGPPGSGRGAARGGPPGSGRGAARGGPPGSGRGAARGGPPQRGSGPGQRREAAGRVRDARAEVAKAARDVAKAKAEAKKATRELKDVAKRSVKDNPKQR